MHGIDGLETTYPEGYWIAQNLNRSLDEGMGRLYLRGAFQRRAGQTSTKAEAEAQAEDVQKTKAKDAQNTVTPDNPDAALYWMIEASMLVSHLLLDEHAEYAAIPILAFLKDNGINTTEESPLHNEQNFWKNDKDLVSVNSNGGTLPNYTGRTEPATIAMLPHMEQKIWNLVRYPGDEYKR